jgi:hypothetical protein
MKSDAHVRVIARGVPRQVVLEHGANARLFRILERGWGGGYGGQDTREREYSRICASIDNRLSPFPNTYGRWPATRQSREPPQRKLLKREVLMQPHDSANHWRGVGFLLLIAPFATACTAWHVQRLAPESVLVARQPTKVLVTRTDGSRQVLNQPTLVQDTLVGTVSRGKTPPGTPLPASGERRIALSDVRHVSTREFSVGNTLGLMVGLGAIGVGGFLALWAISCGGSGCNN